MVLTKEQIQEVIDSLRRLKENSRPSILCQEVVRSLGLSDWLTEGKLDYNFYKNLRGLGYSPMEIYEARKSNKDFGAPCELYRRLEEDGVVLAHQIVGHEVY